MLSFAHQSTFMTDDINKDPVEQIAEIRRTMVQSTRFISLSGLSGVFAGCYALAGVVAFSYYIHRELSVGYTELARQSPVNISLNFVTFCVLDAVVMLALSIITAVVLTRLRAQRDGLPTWTPAAGRMLLSLSIPLVAGGVYCIMLFTHGYYTLIVPATLIFYGLALINASKYTLNDVKFLGIIEVVLGLIACAYLGLGLSFWALGFGVAHIVYGLVMYVKYEARPKQVSRAE